MPTRRLLFPLSLLLLVCSWNAPADTPPPTALNPTTECGKVSDVEFNYNYCISRTPGSRSSDVVWFLHGRGGSEHSWVEDLHSQKMRAVWAGEHIRDVPPVIVVSFGPQWLLTPKLSKPKSGMLEFFESSVIPEMEKKVDFSPSNGRRLLIGESMGGFGATQLVLSRNVDFARAVLACPALAWISPYASFWDMSDWSQANKVNFAIAWSEILTARDFYADTAEWEAASPMYLAHDRLDSRTPPLLVSIGQQDTFGFYPATRDFVTTAQAAGVPSISWRPVPGPHCSFDEYASAQFLLPSS